MSIAKLPKVAAAQFEDQFKANPEKKPVDFNSREVQNFIESAPDGAKRRYKLKGKKVVITLTMNPDDLDRVNEIAADLGMTRAALLNMWIQQQVKKSSIPRKNDDIY